MKNQQGLEKIKLVETSTSTLLRSNSFDSSYKNILINEETWKELEKITTKDIQKLLKDAMNKISKQDFNTKLGIANFNINDITKFRSHCKNVKLID